MAIILNIDTATKTASVSLAENGEVICTQKNDIQKNHAGFLHTAIKEMMDQKKTGFNQIDAIAITSGPGSYTGLRVSFSSAKGICYASGLPFILIDSLACIACAAIKTTNNPEALYCAMIDARRMEVFTATYNHELNLMLLPEAMILNNRSFSNYANRKMVFAGDGAEKFKPVTELKKTIFLNNIDVTQALAQLSFQSFLKQEFADLAYSEPQYLKEFQAS